VSEAVVMVREPQAGGEGRLVAYVVRSAQGKASPGDLRGWLGRRLPEYLVPSMYVFLERLPLTVNGKLDRKALPSPESAGAQESGRAYVAPRNRVEEVLTRVWSQVLGVPRVGVEDNFFELGGDSILSIQVVSRAASEGVRIT